MTNKYWKRLPRKLKKKLGPDWKKYLDDHNSKIRNEILKKAQRNMENMIGYYNYWNINPPNIRGTGRI